VGRQEAGYRSVNKTSLTIIAQRFIAGFAADFIGNNRQQRLNDALSSDSIRANQFSELRAAPASLTAFLVSTTALQRYLSLDEGTVQRFKNSTALRAIQRQSSGDLT
jgi:hypothetical protein